MNKNGVAIEIPEYVFDSSERKEELANLESKKYRLRDMWGT
jgi:hypothetical protein